VYPPDIPSNNLYSEGLVFVLSSGIVAETLDVCTDGYMLTPGGIFFLQDRNDGYFLDYGTNVDFLRDVLFYKAVQIIRTYDKGGIITAIIISTPPFRIYVDYQPTAYNSNMNPVEHIHYLDNYTDIGLFLQESTGYPMVVLSSEDQTDGVPSIAIGLSPEVPYDPWTFTRIYDGPPTSRACCVSFSMLSTGGSFMWFASRNSTNDTVLDWNIGVTESNTTTSGWVYSVMLGGVPDTEDHHAIVGLDGFKYPFIAYKSDGTLIIIINTEKDATGTWGVVAIMNLYSCGLSISNTTVPGYFGIDSDRVIFLNGTTPAFLVRCGEGYDLIKAGTPSANSLWVKEHAISYALGDTTFSTKRQVQLGTNDLNNIYIVYSRWVQFCDFDRNLTIYRNYSDPLTVL
jgi:hypothetical protein